MTLDREPIDIKDPLVDPYKLTEASREAIRNKRRITGIDSIPTEEGTEVRLKSVPFESPYSEGKVPGVDRPYAIYESLTPEDRR